MTSSIAYLPPRKEKNNKYDAYFHCLIDKAIFISKTLYKGWGVFPYLHILVIESFGCTMKAL